MDKNNIPFKILRKFLRNNDSNLTLGKISELLEIPHDRVNKWSCGKLSVSNGIAEDVFFKLFDADSPSNATSFLMHLQTLGYSIPEKLFSSLEENDNMFISFLGDFLAGNIKKQDSLPFKVVTDQHHTIKEYPNNGEYFPQVLYAKKNNAETFNVSTPDFSYFESNSRIFIESPGGQGKSEFLRQFEILSKKAKIFEYVIRFELTDLLSLNNEEILTETVYTKGNTFYISRILERYLTDEALYNLNLHSTDKNHKPILLLLDGLNELYASIDTQKVSAISDELNYISENWNNVYILITSRPDNITEYYKNTLKYETCYLSGVPKEKFDEFIEENSFLDEGIKELLKIPLYFKALSELDDISKLKSKYDAMFEVYNKRFKQNKCDENSFFVFFVLAPRIAQKISTKTTNTITENEILQIVDSLEKVYPNKLIDTAKEACNQFIHFPKADMKKVMGILLGITGPLVRSGDGFKFFHDIARDFMLAFGTIIATKALKFFSEKNDISDSTAYNEIFDIVPNYNLPDEPCELLKEQLGLIKKDEFEKVISELYSFDEGVLITPQLILYAHTSFLISDYLNLGTAILKPVHNALLNFTNSISCYVEDEILKEVFRNLSEQQKTYCRKCLSHIISKHCEYYRREHEYNNCLNFISLAEKIYDNSDEITNQKAKVYIILHQEHIKHPENDIFDLKSHGFKDYSELFFEGFRLLKETAHNEFNLSVNLFSMLNTVPAPYLFEDDKIDVSFDFITSFLLNYNTIVNNSHHDDYYIREIDYSVRQAVGLLLKGYVQVNPDIKYTKWRPLSAKSIVLGNKNTLNLDSQTLELAEFLLEFANGTNRASMNYYRGILSFYKGDYEKMISFFDKEQDISLKTIFLKYWEKNDSDISNVYENIKNHIYEDSRNAADACHPIYWLIDCMNLQKSFGEKNIDFYENFEKELPEKWQKLIAQLTQ